MLLTRERETARATFAPSSASYIPRDDDDAWLRGFPTSRRSSGFAVWMALRAHGWNAVRGAVRSNIELIRLLEGPYSRSGDSGCFRTASCRSRSLGSSRRVERPTSSMRSRRRSRSGSSLRGEAWFATTRHDDATWMRFNLVNLHTREHHIRRLADLVVETARSVAGN